MGSASLTSNTVLTNTQAYTNVIVCFLSDNCTADNAMKMPIVCEHPLHNADLPNVQMCVLTVQTFSVQVHSI